MSLFGIVKFAEDHFVCDFEAGRDESIRPQSFDKEQLQKFYRIEN